MSKSRFWESVSLFESGLSAAEWTWRIGTLVFLGSTGTATALLARADPLLGQLGPIYWIAVGILTASIVALIFYLYKSALLKQAQTDASRILATPRNSVNPLSDSFRDEIIPVEDLRLPLLQLHENKHFRRCVFVGPAALAIIGGNYINSGFTECGDIMALPVDFSMTGIIVLKNCTVEDCTFIRVTIFADQNTARGFSTIPGAQVKGLQSEQT